jgi:adenosylcobyric acid synthase
LLDIVDSDTGGWIPEGACSTDGRVWGTYVHGLFDSPGFRRVFLDRLHAGRGCPPLAGRAGPSLEDALDRWADHVGRHIEMAGVAAVVEAGV